MAPSPTRDRSMSKVRPSDAPRAERGSATGIPVASVLSWAALGAGIGNDLEYVPDLQWPNNVATYQKMRNDSQVDGLHRGTVLPITRWPHGLNPNNADPVLVRELSRDTGLPIMERNGDTWREVERPGVPRSRNRFNFREHQDEALLATLFGHNYFEQVADLISPPDDWPIDTPLRARLWKLAIRPPWTIAEINTQPDGGLDSIRQLHQSFGEPPIPVSSLVAYVWGKEGANWVGRSLLRSSYRPWLVKDRILRVGAINIERNGAGVPIITAPPGATDGQIRMLEDLATRVRAGDSAGGAIPSGSTLNLMGVIGTQPDAVGFMRFLDQQMARSFLQMVGELGQTPNGSRALGGTLMELLEWLLESIADWFCEVFYEHVILDWWDWNVPRDLNPNADEFAPRLVYAKTGQATDGLNEGVENGDITVDPATQAALAGGRGRATSRRAAAGGHGGRRHGERQERPGTELRAETASLPARSLRRQPYDHEIAAATDFAALDSAYASALDLLQMEVRQLIRYQVDELHDAIVEAGGDLDDIAEISASLQHRDVIVSRISQVADLAASEAVNEASRQGVSIERPDLADLQSSLATRAGVLDTMITRDVTEAAVRRAVRMTGGTLEPSEVADQVRDELAEMTWAGVRDQLGGAVQGAQNAARALVFRRDGEGGTVYSSELLDSNTCGNCVAIDGTVYASMDEAERDYPFGGYLECEGRERCRGTLVKVYSAENPATLSEPFGGAS